MFCVLILEVRLFLSVKLLRKGFLSLQNYTLFTFIEFTHLCVNTFFKYVYVYSSQMNTQTIFLKLILLTKLVDCLILDVSHLRYYYACYNTYNLRHKHRVDVVSMRLQIYSTKVFEDHRQTDEISICVSLHKTFLDSNIISNEPS